MFDEASLRRVGPKLRSKPLRVLLDYWDRRRTSQWMPTRSAIDPGHLPDQAPWLVLAAVAWNPLRFQFLTVGSELQARLGYRLTGTTIDAEAGMFYKAYAACATEIRVTREFAQYDFGDGGGPVSFERLLLPLSDDGETVTAVLGGIVYTDHAMVTDVTPGPSPDPSKKS